MSNAKKNKTDRCVRTTPTCIENPFAVSSSGVVLLNVQNFDNVETTEDALRHALRDRAPIFISVAVKPQEVRFVLEHLRDIVHEPAWFVIGRRQRRAI